MTITLNGEPHDLPSPLTVTELLTHLQIDPRRVAVELNLTVLKRATFDSTVVREGDQVEIVNFVGGGACPPSLAVSLPLAHVRFHTCRAHVPIAADRRHR